jgi:hypothetical protein
MKGTNPTGRLRRPLWTNLEVAVYGSKIGWPRVGNLLLTGKKARTKRPRSFRVRTCLPSNARLRIVSHGLTLECES